MGRNNSKAQRGLRQTQAAERQAKYDRLSAEDKLAQASTRPGHSLREKARVKRDA